MELKIRASRGNQRESPQRTQKRRHHTVIKANPLLVSSDTVVQMGTEKKMQRKTITFFSLIDDTNHGINVP